MLLENCKNINDINKFIKENNLHVHWYDLAVCDRITDMIDVVRRCMESRPQQTANKMDR